MIKKLINKLSVCFIIVLCFLFNTNISLGAISSDITPSKNHEYNNTDYVIDKYDVNIVVNENNTFDITETITAYFNVPKHGIFRTIPLKNTITRLDGSTSTNHTKIRNLSVNTNYSISRENGNYKIKIGSADKTLTGEQTYVIKYTYDLGKDPIKDYDELYYNIIGTEWDTVIGNISFSITMPKEFDQNKIGFSAGKKGYINNTDIYYSISGNTITGSYNGILNSKEGLTIRCELPEGYFINSDLITKIIFYIIFIIPIIFLVISIFLWYKYGRDNKAIETVEFYPPQGLNSLDVGFFYKGKAENKDVTSLLIYLANKGYIEIVDQENSADSKKGILNKNKFLFRKLKPYDGSDINEKLFMEGLFKNNSKEVTTEMLYNKFYKTNDAILRNTNSWKNKCKIFESISTLKSLWVILMVIITYCLITIPPIYNYSGLENIFLCILFPGITITILFYTLSRKSKIFQDFLILIFGLGVGFVPWINIVFPALLQDSSYLTCYISGIICIFGMLLCILYLPKRTKYGTEILGYLKGFKNFLETAEKEKLEALVLDNPNYFYDILPYTYVLNVSDKWIKNFESISLQEPSWYDSSTSFNVSSFGTSLNSQMTYFQNAITSVPTSSGYSGGFSSGGGFSGGGSGGGGGGSW